MRALSFTDPRHFIDPTDEGLPPEEQTVFDYDLLTAEQHAHYLDVLARYGSGTATIDVLNMALKGVRNLRTADGDTVEFVRDESRGKLPGGVRPWAGKCLDRIPGAARDRLAARIILDSDKVPEDTAKKS